MTKHSFDFDAACIRMPQGRLELLLTGAAQAHFAQGGKGEQLFTVGTLGDLHAILRGEVEPDLTGREREQILKHFRGKEVSEADLVPEIVLVDQETDKRFRGVLIARATTRFDRAVTRWTQLSVYRTAKGKLVAHEATLVRDSPKPIEGRLTVCERDEEVVKALGYGSVAKSIYDALGISYVEDLDV